MIETVNSDDILSARIAGYKDGAFMAVTPDACPYNGEELRQAWLSGYREARKSLPPIPAPPVDER